MFHANAWGLPYGAALAGADLILPDRFLGAEPLAQLIEAERPTLMGCVPTIFADLLRYADEHPDVDLSLADQRDVRRLGGAATADEGLRGAPRRAHLPGLGDDRDQPRGDVLAARRRASTTTRYWDARAKQGRPLPWVELRLVGDDGAEVPWDGESTGEIEVRGPWIAARYFDDDRRARSSTRAGCAPATSPRSTTTAFVQITDRSKDVIKSGGEWISSVELENELMAHPDVVEAAVIAKPDERWAERPLCCVVLREGASASAEELRRAPARARRQVVAARRVRVRRRRSRRRASASSTRRCCERELAEDALEGRVLLMVAAVRGARVLKPVISVASRRRLARAQGCTPCRFGDRRR